MDILMFLADTTEEVSTLCTENTMKLIMNIAKLVLNVIRILVPIALIVLGSIDIGKAVIAGDEKKIKEAQKPFVRRVIAAVIVFLIPWIVDLVMTLAKGTDYQQCWSQAEGTIEAIQQLY